MLTLRELIRTPLSFLFVTPTMEERVVQYLIREHHNGRSVIDVLEDPFVRNRLRPEQRTRLLDHPELAHAVASDLELARTPRAA